MQLVDQPNGTFTTAELVRLAAYRAAVQAGFYTDWDGSATSTDTAELAWLNCQPNAAAEYPFTADERQKLEALHAAYAAGGYAEDRPCTDVTPTE